MKITILPSDKGDCLFVTGKDGTTILVDGGMRASYIDHVRSFWADLGKKFIDLVYVSHIDQDHIAGVLQMMDDLVAWRVYENRKSDGWEKPKFPMPPTPRALWHNAFHDQVGKNAGEIESMLAAAAGALSNSSNPRLRSLATEYHEIATSIPEAVRLSQRISAEQLGIPLNKAFKGKLAMVRKGAKSLTLGSMRVSIVGPFETDLERLKTEWNQWLRNHQADIAELRRRARDDEELFDSGATRLGALGTDDGLGKRNKVTAPNLASLMLLIEEDGQQVVLTGDGHHREIVKGLELKGVLPKNGGGGHVGVWKVQHHGSEHNIDLAFARRLTADHYIFCGNGKHENPDFRVVDIIAEARISTDPAKSSITHVDRPFTFWFSSSAGFPGADRGHMTEVEKKVKKHAARSNGRMRFKFLTKKTLELDLTV